MNEEKKKPKGEKKADPVEPQLPRPKPRPARPPVPPVYEERLKR